MAIEPFPTVSSIVYVCMTGLGVIGVLAVCNSSGDTYGQVEHPVGILRRTGVASSTFKKNYMNDGNIVFSDDCMSQLDLPAGAADKFAMRPKRISFI